MDPSTVAVPPMKDLTPDNITPNTIITNSQGPDRRLRYILERLVSHLHDFTRETQLSTDEWMAGIKFLTAVGQISSNTRQVGDECGQVVNEQGTSGDERRRVGNE